MYPRSQFISRQHTELTRRNKEAVKYQVKLMKNEVIHEGEAPAIANHVVTD